MGVPQVIILLMLAVDLKYTMARHRQEQGPYDVRVTGIMAGALIGLLWIGGFFK